VLETFSVAFVVPLQGPTGIYGPSCLACGELAAEQLNARSGVAGRRIDLVIVDGGRPPELVAAEVGHLVESRRVQAVAGWHISTVRQAITRRIGGQVVYAYAAMHEGRDDTAGVFMLGERAAPASRVGAAMTLLAGATGIGYAVGSAVAGRLADVHGHTGAFAVTVTAAASAAVLAAAAQPLLRRIGNTDSPGLGARTVARAAT